LVDVAEQQGHEQVARLYVELRERGQQLGRRVTADVVANLADYLAGGAKPKRLEALFVPRRIEAAKPRKTTRSKSGKGAAGEPVTGTVVASGEGGEGSFQNFGMSPGGAGTGGWSLSPEHVARLSSWIADGAGTAGISPDHAAGVLVQALTDSALADWIAAPDRT
ncbi:hypothetical protein, partial [Streptomyces rubiginosohelvolus]